MKTISNKQIFIYLGSALIIILLVIFGYFPLARSTIKIQDQITDQRIELASLKNQQRPSEPSQINESELTAKLTELNSYFIDHDKILEYISLIEDTAKKHQVVEQLNLGELPEAEGIFEHPITLDLTGSYSDVIQVLTDFEKLNYYFIFNKIEITRAGAATGDFDKNQTAPINNIKLTLTGLTYWR